VVLSRRGGTSTPFFLMSLAYPQTLLAAIAAPLICALTLSAAIACGYNRRGSKDSQLR
jgi:hypothetical protein